MKSMPSRNLNDFFTAWWFLNQHPAFVEQVTPTYKDNNFQDALDVYVTKVNPKTKSIDDDESKNTLTQVWLECGKWMTAKEVTPPGTPIDPEFMGAFCHDVKLDCGADTYELAICRLAQLVLTEYGDYPEE